MVGAKSVVLLASVEIHKLVDEVFPAWIQEKSSSIHLIFKNHFSTGETPAQGLIFLNNKLFYRSEKMGDLALDWDQEIEHYERHTPKGRQELISRAVGLHKEKNLRVLDATLGLAQDAIFLASLGARVKGCEKNPIIFLLLLDASRRLQNPDFKQRIELHYGDSREFIQSFSSEIDVVYLDPMFKEGKKKSALPRKEMQIFRAILSEQDDGLELLKVALSKTNARIVLKRPLKAAEMLPGKAHSVLGSTVRYDIYKGGLKC